MKNSSKLLLGITIFLSLNFLSKELIGDFSRKHLFEPLLENPIKEDQGIPDFLRQKYTYLGKGNQAFVFLSEDKKHVLKVFRPLFPSFQISIFGKKYRFRPLKLPFAKTLMEKIYAQEFAEQKEKDLQSFVNAYAFLKEETGLEYLHLAKTKPLGEKLELYDKIGVQHLLNLDNTCFLVQKKTDLLYPTLASFLQKNEIDKAKELLASFVNFSYGLIKKGVDHPTSIERNLGCIGLSPFQIDVGRVFIKDLPLDTQIEQFIQTTQHMSKWISAKAPDLEPYLKSLIEERKSLF